MASKDIKLWENNIPDSDLFSTEGDINNEGLPSITPYILEGEKLRPTIIVCPGGAFQLRAGNEGVPIALWLNQIGINAIIVNYRVAPFSPVTSIKDAVRAVKYIRYHARELNIDPERIGMIGFSAGGYITSFLGTHLDNEMIKPEGRYTQIMSALLGEPDLNDPIDQTSAKLNAIILCYAETAPFSSEKLPPTSWIPEDITIDEFIDFYTNHKHVSVVTPPTFLWITSKDDWNFQPQNLLFAQALYEHDLSFDMHVFTKGNHGMGLANDEPTVAAWTKLCENWLQTFFV